MTRNPTHWLRIAIAAGGLLVVVTACGNDSETAKTSDSTAARAPSTSFVVEGGVHVDGPVVYAQTPPAGGDHNPVWQNCGAYTQPVPNETAVHSMEHGAVWITFQPALDSAQVKTLAGYTTNQTHVLVSPFEGLPAPIVASAWGAQARFEAADDAGIAAFIQQYQLSAQSPEPGAPCSRGVGEPA